MPNIEAGFQILSWSCRNVALEQLDRSKCCLGVTARSSWTGRNVAWSSWKGRNVVLEQLEQLDPPKRTKVPKVPKPNRKLIVIIYIFYFLLIEMPTANSARGQERKSSFDGGACDFVTDVLQNRMPTNSIYRKWIQNPRTIPKS